MKALVIYDSQFGNTEKVANAIADGLRSGAETTLLHAAAVTPQAMSGCELLVVGSPTQRFHATKPVDDLLQELSLSDVRAATFDTRFDRAEVDVTALRLAMKIAGDNAWAAPRIATQLKKAGAKIVVPPEGFIVEDTEGPLRPGELERATEWAVKILESVKLP
ncbi:MAG: flavodoxin family protein [Chloroflexota bacterium]|jgi:flavodoxin I